MLIVSNLSVAVGGRVILRDVSFSVGRGEVFYVLSPNGVGIVIKGIGRHPGVRDSNWRVETRRSGFDR